MSASIWNPANPTNAISIFWPITTEEQAAGVLPSNFTYPPGNILRYGAVGDGVTDSSLAITRAISCNTEVFIPPYTFRASNVSLRPGILIFGAGVNSKIRPVNSNDRAVFTTDSGSASAFISNVVVKNFCLFSDVATTGFSEQKHLMTINGGRNWTISEMYFEGFRGDGLYIGSGDLGGQERHNQDITVVNCYFDGVNKDNRNGISVIDGDGIKVLDNTFVNLSRSNMPGAIDFEPDTNPFHIIRNVLIRGNRIKNSNGGVAAIQVYVPSTITDVPKNIVIDGNTIEDVPNSLGVYVNLGRGNTYSNNQVVISNNAVTNAFRGFEILGLSNAVVSGNTFGLFKSASLVGLVGGTNKVFSVIISNNIFSESITGGDGSALAIEVADRVTVTGNQFIDIGDDTGGGEYVKLGINGITSDITIEGNNFYSNAGATGSAVIQQPTHTTTPSSNIFRNNILAPSLNHNFQAYLNDDCGTVINLFTPATTEASFPVGRSVAVLNGASGLPAGYSQGVFITERMTKQASYTAWTTQTYIPRNNDATSLKATYIRKSDTVGNWSAWTVLTAV